jgi:hypothetical protein
LSVSKPIYSSNGKYAIIGFSRGNNGGQITLYEKINENWKIKKQLSKWAY